jgi:hypothetical protein
MATCCLPRPLPASTANLILGTHSDHAKAFFGLLKRQKDAIERELGYPLEWEELPEGNDCRIASYLNDVAPADKADWPRQHEWMAKRLNDMHRVFANRISALDADAWRPENGN